MRSPILHRQGIMDKILKQPKQRSPSSCPRQTCTPAKTPFYLCKVLSLNSNSLPLSELQNSPPLLPTTDSHSLLSLYLMCMNVLPTYLPDVTGDQKKGLDPLGLKLQVIISQHTGTKKRIWSLQKTSHLSCPLNSHS